MNKTFVATAEMVSSASPTKVWDLLTNPEKVKEYLFGTELVTTWRVGSSITYRGEWQGKSYEDKGKVLKFEPEREIVSTYWSSFSGLPDLLENYQTVTYRITSTTAGTKLQIIQEGSKSEESAKHSEGNWKMVLEKMQEMLSS